jgi:hypothetical protein
MNRHGEAEKMLMDQISTSITALEATPDEGTVCQYHGSLTAGITTLLKIEKYRFSANGKGFWYNLGKFLRGASRL